MTDRSKPKVNAFRNPRLEGKVNDVFEALCTTLAQETTLGNGAVAAGYMAGAFVWWLVGKFGERAAKNLLDESLRRAALAKRKGMN